MRRLIMSGLIWIYTGIGFVLQELKGLTDRSGLVRQRCRVSCVTVASNWYWLTVGQGLLSLQQVKVEGECFYFLSFFTFIHFLARLNNVHRELLFYPRRRHWCRCPQMLKFSLKFFKSHYFLTLSPIWLIFGMIIHIGPKFWAVPSPLP